MNKLFYAGITLLLLVFMTAVAFALNWVALWAAMKVSIALQYEGGMLMPVLFTQSITWAVLTYFLVFKEKS